MKYILMIVFAITLVSVKSQISVKYKSYSVIYDTALQLPTYSKYLSTRKQLQNITSKRFGEFMVDKKVKNCQSPSKYIGLPLDKGHNVPAEDMRFDSVSEKECFYMTNMSPQYPYFNRGIWKSVETKVREFVVKKDSCIVFTGCYKCDSITVGKLKVPGYFYKVVYSLKDRQQIAFLLKHEKSDKSVFTFVIPIKTLENKIGYKFNIPDSTKNNINLNYWIK